MKNTGGVFFDLRKSALLQFWPTPNPLYYTCDLLASGFTAAMWTCGHSAGPLACPSRGAGPPIASPSRSARPRNCLYLT